jgi:hypothetical protein
MTEEHPRHRCHAASRKLSAPLGQGYYSTPRDPRTGDRRPPKGLHTRERPPHRKVSWPAAAGDGRVSDRNLRCTNGTTQGMTACSSSHTRGTHIVGAATIMKDATLALKGPIPRHSGVLCAMLVFRDIFRRQALTFRMQLRKCMELSM